MQVTHSCCSIGATENIAPGTFFQLIVYNVFHLFLYALNAQTNT